MVEITTVYVIRVKIKIKSIKWKKVKRKPLCSERKI